MCCSKHWMACQLWLVSGNGARRAHFLYSGRATKPAPGSSKPQKKFEALRITVSPTATPDPLCTPASRVFWTSVADAACISNYSDYHSAKAHTCWCRVGTSTDPGACSASFRCESCAAAPKTYCKYRTAMSYRFAIQLYVQNLTPCKILPNDHSLSTAQEPVPKRGVAQIKTAVFKRVLQNGFHFWWNFSTWQS